MTALRLTESQEQELLVRWFDIQYPKLKGRLVASMNGAWVGGSGKSRYALVAKYKRGGMQKGFPDLSLPVPSSGYHGLYIELKRTKGGVATPEQKDWIAFLQEQGYKAEVCKGFEAAKRLIEDYLQN